MNTETTAMANNPYDYNTGFRLCAHQWVNGAGRTVFMLRSSSCGARSNLLANTRVFPFPRYYPQYRFGTKFNRHARDEKVIQPA